MCNYAMYVQSPQEGHLIKTASMLPKHPNVQTGKLRQCRMNNVSRRQFTSSLANN